MSHRERVVRSPQERRAVETAVRALRAAAPLGWQRLRFTFYATVGIDSASFESIAADGSTHSAVPPGQAITQLDELRAVMYRPGEGAWFTARLTIERSGGHDIEFEYDREPDFTPPLTASVYKMDLEYFPRTAEHIPDWLRDRLLRTE